MIFDDLPRFTFPAGVGEGRPGLLCKRTDFPAFCFPLTGNYLFKTQVPKVCGNLLLTHSRKLGQVFERQTLGIELKRVNDLAFAGRKLPMLLLRRIPLHKSATPDVSDPSHLDQEVRSVRLTQLGTATAAVPGAVRIVASAPLILFSSRL